MAATPDALPTDPADLHQYCLQLLAELGDKQQLIDKLTHQLALFRRYLYGRRSEQLDPAQLLLEFARWAQAQETEATPSSPPPPAAPTPARSRGHGRTPLPALLPRRRVEHTLPPERCTCTACGTPLVKIGEETSEQLDYQPASLFVTEHVRFTYACRACEETVVTAARPAAPIEKGRPGPGLLAQVVTAKYADHVPLNRQAEIFARHGVTLARQTLGDWVAAAAELLTPLYEDLRTAVLASKVIHTDDTGPPGTRSARTRSRTSTSTPWWTGSSSTPTSCWGRPCSPPRKWRPATSA